MRRLLLFCAPAVLLASATSAQTLFHIQFHGGEPESSVLRVPAGGWPLTVTLTAADEVLHRVGAVGSARDDRVRWILEDPDGCPSWLDPEMRFSDAEAAGPANQCRRSLDAEWPADEIALDLLPGVVTAPVGDCGDQLRAQTFDAGTEANTAVTPVGPCADLGRTYGAHPSMPSLVLLADAGPGVVTTVALKRLEPRLERNLAGFFQTFGAVWRDAQNRRSASAHMVAPRFLFSSLVAEDYHYDGVLDTAELPILDGGGEDNTLEPLEPIESCSPWVAVDGGEPACAATLLRTATTLRAFVVHGEAPALLEDADGDGDVDAADAVRSGYTLLSNEARLRVVEHLGQQRISVDLDGNGAAFNSFPVPGSPVQIPDPPP